MGQKRKLSPDTPDEPQKKKRRVEEPKPSSAAPVPGTQEVVKELLGAGADVNAKNDKGLTPLFVTTLQWPFLVTSD